MRYSVLFLIAAAGLFAQQSPSPAASASDPTIRLDVRQVLVPVIVTDKKGHHASGLRASDFRIFEDGVPQEIASFSSDTAASVDDVTSIAEPAAKAGAGPAARAGAGPRRTYVICIDTLHASPANAARVRDALESLFEKERGTDAQYVLIGIGRQLQVLQTATTNPLAILLKVRSVAFQSSMGGLDASALAAALNNLKNRMEDFCRRCACGARSSQRSCDSDVETLKQSVDAEAARWTALTDGLGTQFRNVVEELAKLPTGRTLILVSDGFELNPTREFNAVVSAYLPNSPLFRQDNTKDTEPLLRDALKIAAERNVAIYAIDSRGGFSPSLSSAGPMDASGSGGSGGYQSVIGGNRQTAGTRVGTVTLQAAPGQQANPFPSEDSAAMAELARATGGVYFHDSKDLLKQFRGALADGRQYYVLAYVPKNAAADGTFRRITVSVAGSALTIRAKAGYWAPRSDQ